MGKGLAGMLLTTLLLAGCVSDWGWEKPVFKPPEQLAGAAQDEIVLFQVRVLWHTFSSYKVAAKITNKSDQSVHLWHDCGSLLSWEGLEPAEEDGADRGCSGADSMLLEAGTGHEFESLHPARLVSDWSDLKVSIRYQVSSDGNTLPPVTLTVPLQEVYK